MLSSDPKTNSPTIANKNGEAASFSPQPLSQTLPIEKLVHGGMALGRVESQVIFVKGGIPGETLLVKIGEERKGFRMAELLQVEQSSPDRVAPPCPVYGLCGGCQLQHLTYDGQVTQKWNMLQDALSRIGKLTIPVIPNVVPSSSPYGYRNSARFQIFKEKQRFYLGFYEQGSRKAIRVNECLLIPEESNQIAESVADRLANMGSLPVFLESVEIRRSTAFGHAMLIFRGVYKRANLGRFFLNLFKDLPTVAGCVLESSVHSHTEGSSPPRLIEGKDHLIEKFDELGLRIGFRSFMQSNWSVYEAIGRTLIEWIGDVNRIRVLELYAGVGALGLNLARRGALVTLVEPNSFALADARQSASLNHVGRCRFRNCSAEEFLGYISQGEYDVGIVDPPRTGLSNQATKDLGKGQIHRLYYLSCDAPTLARDLSRLCDYGYRIARVLPFDMFPQTAHIETLVELVV